MKKTFVSFIALCLICSIIPSCSMSGNSTIIVHSSFVSGNLEDCGCPGDHVGGIARRADQVAKFDKNALLQLDPGGFSNLSTVPGIVMTEGVLDAYEAMDIKAVNICVKELSGGLPTLDKITSGSDLDFVSANIVWKETGLPLYKSFVLVSVGEKKYAVIGFCHPTFKTWKSENGRTVETLDPLKVLPGIIEKARLEADCVILLGHYPLRKIDSLLSQLPQVDIVIGGDGYSETRDLTIIHGAVVSYAGREGKNLGIIKFGHNNNSHEQSLIRLTKDLPEDPAIKGLVDNYLSKAKKAEDS